MQNVERGVWQEGQAGLWQGLSVSQVEGSRGSTGQCSVELKSEKDVGLGEGEHA